MKPAACCDMRPSVCSYTCRCDNTLTVFTTQSQYAHYTMIPTVAEAEITQILSVSAMPVREGTSESHLALSRRRRYLDGRGGRLEPSSPLHTGLR